MNHQPIVATTAQSFVPKISVVIPIYNGEGDLPDLLSCLLSQTYPKDQVEYLLVDNNSSDRTLSILEKTAENAPITIRPFSENNIQMLSQGIIASNSINDKLEHQNQQFVCLLNTSG